MTTENLGSDPYEAVIADLVAKRDEMDRAIAFLSGVRALQGGVPLSVGVAASPNSDNGIVETAGMFLGMSIVDAAKKLLAMRKRTMGNVEIAREIQAGGLVLSGKDPVNVVGSVLTRRFNDTGDIVKVGRGIWGLKEWYPGRNFKPAMKIIQSEPADPFREMTPEQKAVMDANIATLESEEVKDEDPFAALG